MKGGIVWIMALSCDYRFLFLSVFYVGHPDSLVWANRRGEREEWLREGAKQELLRKVKSGELIQRNPAGPPLRPAED